MIRTINLFLCYISFTMPAQIRLDKGGWGLGSGIGHFNSLGFVIWSFHSLGFGNDVFPGTGILNFIFFRIQDSMGFGIYYFKLWDSGIIFLSITMGIWFIFLGIWDLMFYSLGFWNHTPPAPPPPLLNRKQTFLHM